jgi:hypothetical protein
MTLGAPHLRILARGEQVVVFRGVVRDRVARETFLVINTLKWSTVTPLTVLFDNSM